MKRQKILLVESSEIIVSGLYKQLETSDFEITAHLPSAEGLAEHILQTKATMLIINPSLLGADAALTIHHLSTSYPNMAIIGLVHAYHAPSVLRMFSALIDINDNQRQIEVKLKTAAEEQQSHLAPASTGKDYELSQREKDVLVLVAKGLMNKEIADKLHLSIHTVITHRKNITHKTDIKSVAGLTVYALLNHLIDEDDIL